MRIIEYTPYFYESLLRLLNDIYSSNISKQDLESNYLSNNKKIYLAQINNEIVGCAFLEIRTDLIRPYKYGFLSYVAVDNNYRRCGVGRELTGHIIKCARELGCSTLELTSANSRVGAHSFYESIGFTKKNTTVFIKDPI